MVWLALDRPAAASARIQGCNWPGGSLCHRTAGGGYHRNPPPARRADPHGRKVKAAQQSLHSYIGAITAGQEEERRQLARELHDDTIQSLIALKQRVQLAQLATKNGSYEESLTEVVSLTEQAIENVRRQTRALRPIYLEDLGLVTALEMLARETGQTLSIAVGFHRQGIEKTV